MDDIIADELAEALNEKIKDQHQRRQTFRYSDIKAISKTAEGRRVLYWILDIAGIHRQPFSGENSHLTAFNCGKMQIGNSLLIDMMTADKTILAKAQNEYEALEKQYQIELENIKKKYNDENA